MKIVNVHERDYGVLDSTLGALVDGLSSKNDRLWPARQWPSMRLNGPLAVGASGGHGRIRYNVEAYEPGRHLRLRFTAPPGFVGTHSFEVVPRSGETRLRHVLDMEAMGIARVSWPLVYRPLHDALLEDLLDRAAIAVGVPTQGTRWSTRVRVLRWLLSRRRLLPVRS